MTDVGRPDSSKVNEQETMRPSRRVRTSKVSLCACKIKYGVPSKVYYVGEREDFLKLQESSVKYIPVYFNVELHYYVQTLATSPEVPIIIFCWVAGLTI